MAKKKALNAKKTKVSKKEMLVGKPPFTGNSDAWVAINKKTGLSQGFDYNSSNGLATVKVTVEPKGQNPSNPVEFEGFDFSDITCRATLSGVSYVGNPINLSISSEPPPSKTKLFTFIFQFPPGLSFAVPVTDPPELVVTVLTKKGTQLT